MINNAVLLLALLVFAFSLVSKRLEESSLTAPMFFVGVGLLTSRYDLGFAVEGQTVPFVTFLAEATLIFILFTDASRIDLRRLRRQANLPLRLLVIGMPLQILLGTVTAKVLLPTLSWWQAALLSAVLAPTDAALGQAVVTNPAVPVRIRQTLNVESGLNDGLALPVVTIFLATCLAREQREPVTEWLGLIAEQLLLGVVAGVVIGWVAPRLIERASARGWMDPVFRQLASLGSAIAAYSLAQALGGNGFIAAFVAGAVFAAATPGHCDSLVEFSETEGQLLSLLTFFFFGAALLPAVLVDFSWVWLLYALASLTVVRMLPVAVALLGTGMRPVTVAFLGWFGPRGLASILFTLLIVEGAPIDNAETIIGTAMLTVLASIVLHGISARSLANRLAKSLAARPLPEAGVTPEHAEAPALPTRFGHDPSH